MSLDVTGALREGAVRTASRNGATLVAATAVVALAGAVAAHALRAALPPPFGAAVAATGLFGLVAGSGLGSLAVPLPPSLAAVVWVTAVVVGESVRVVALRTFAGEPAPTIPMSASRDRLGPATLHSLLADAAARLAVAAGLVLLVVPGLVLAVGLAFVRASVAVEDRGPVAAVVRSWRLTADDRLATLGLVAAVVAAGLGAAALAVGARLALGGVSPALGALVAVVVASAGLVFGVAAVARAFVQLAGTP